MSGRKQNTVSFLRGKEETGQIQKPAECDEHLLVTAENFVQSFQAFACEYKELGGDGRGELDDRAKLWMWTVVLKLEDCQTWIRYLEPQEAMHDFLAQTLFVNNIKDLLNEVYTKLRTCGWSKTWLYPVRSTRWNKHMQWELWQILEDACDVLARNFDCWASQEKRRIAAAWSRIAEDVWSRTGNPYCVRINLIH